MLPVDQRFINYLLVSSKFACCIAVVFLEVLHFLSTEGINVLHCICGQEVERKVRNEKLSTRETVTKCEATKKEQEYFISRAIKLSLQRDSVNFMTLFNSLKFLL